MSNSYERVGEWGGQGVGRLGILNPEISLGGI